MKNRRILKKTLAWITLTAILVSGVGCSKAMRVDITEKTNTERLEDTAIVTLSASSVAQPVAEEAKPAASETIDFRGRRLDEVSIPSSPLYDLLGASTRYSVDLTPKSDIVKIIVDADVYLPDTMQMPALHVTPRDFTQEEVTKLFNALCGDTVMYKAQEQMTKEEVAERIADVESEMKTATDKDRLKKLESNLAYWKEDYEKAPETVEKQISDGTLEERQLGIGEYLGKYKALDAYEHQEGYYTYGGKSFHVTGQTYDKNTKSSYDFPISGSIWYNRDQTFGQYLDNNVRKWIADETAVPADAAGLKMTPVEARKLVEAFWADNGFEDMVVTGVYLTQNSDPDLGGGADEPDPYGDNSAYVVACGRSIDGILPPPPCPGDPHWAFESCTFTITDNGIESFNWFSPYAYGEYVTQSSALMTFDKIDEIFRKMMLVKYDEHNSNDLTSATYRVDRVALEMSRVTNRKSSEKGLLVPVWNFYGSYYFTYEHGGNFGSDDREDFPSPLLRINAIDGTVIEPRYGC